MYKVLCGQPKLDFRFKILIIPGSGSVWYDLSLSLLDFCSESQLLVSLGMRAEKPRLSMLSRLAVFDIFSFTVGLLGCKLSKSRSIIETNNT